MIEIFTKYEVARILGARALQISMDAPLLIKIEKEELERIRYDPIKIAELEFNGEVLPITVKRPLPKKTEGKLRREVIPEKKPEDAKVLEEAEEKEIQEGAEIMELAKPDDEVEETESSGEEAAE
ncbi:MAG: DNA-directed RNA polymerase subunit K [Nanoarchaeota archaeon]